MKKEILKKSLLALTLTGLTGLTSSAFAASVNLGLSTADIKTTVNGNVITGTCEITTGPKIVALPKVSTGAITASAANALIGATPFELEITKCDPTELEVEIIGQQLDGKYLKNEADPGASGANKGAEGVALNIAIKSLAKTVTTAAAVSTTTYTPYTGLDTATTRKKVTYAGLMDTASTDADKKALGKIYLQAGLVKTTTAATAGKVTSNFIIKVNYK